MMQTQDFSGSPLPPGSEEVSIAIRQSGFWMRGCLFGVQGAMPLLVYLALAGDIEHSLYAWFELAWLGFLFLLVNSLVFAYAAASRGSTGIWYAALLGLAAVISSYIWYIFANGAAVALVLVLFSFAVLFRLRGWLVQQLTSRKSRQAFMVDSIAIVIVGVYSGLVGSPAGVNSSILSFTALFACLTVLLRLYVLWFIERQINGTPLSARSSWLPLLLLAVVTAIFGPGLFFHAFSGLIGLFLILFYPFFLLLLALHLHSHLPGRILQTEYAPGTKNIPASLQKPELTPAWAHLVPIVALVVLLLVLVYLLFRRTKAQAAEEGPTIQSIEVIERRAISSQRGLSFLFTTGPARQKVQEWLANKYKQGVEIKPTQTIRQFTKEHGPLPTASLLPDYENERYNRAFTHEQGAPPQVREDG